MNCLEHWEARPFSFWRPSAICNLWLNACRVQAARTRDAKGTARPHATLLLRNSTVGEYGEMCNVGHPEGKQLPWLVRCKGPSCHEPRHSRYFLMFSGIAVMIGCALGLTLGYVLPLR